MELVDNPFVSEFTAKTLTQFGWQSGDPIPAELGELLLRFKTAAPPSTRTDVLVDAALLTEKDIDDVRAMLAAAKEELEKRNKAAELDKQTANMTPDVAAFYKQLESAGPTIVDDRETEQPKEPVMAAAVDQAPPAQEAQVAGDPPMIILPFCPRCGWDMRQKFDITVTDKDKEDFLAAVLGNTRFERRYELMGGKVVLVFRSMLAEENRLVHRQLVLDQDSKDIVTDAEWFLRMMEYRLACSLDRVENGSGKVLHEVPRLDEMAHKPPENRPLETALVTLREYVNNKVLAHEVTRRLAGQQFRQFQRLVEALEAMALEPSFWNGIG